MAKQHRWIIGYKGTKKPDEQALTKLGLTIVDRHTHEDGGLLLARSDKELSAEELGKVRQVPGVAHIEADQEIRLT